MPPFQQGGAGRLISPAINKRCHFGDTVFVLFISILCPTLVLMNHVANFEFYEHFDKREFGSESPPNSSL
jgi:hypothetical protein